MCVCVCVCVYVCVCVCNLLNCSSVFDGNLCPCYTFFFFFFFLCCNCYVVCHAILLIFMYVFCVFAPLQPFPPLFLVIYCKRLGLLRLGISIHNNNNNNNQIISVMSKAKSAFCHSVSAGLQGFLWASTGLGDV